MLVTKREAVSKTASRFVFFCRSGVVALVMALGLAAWWGWRLWLLPTWGFDPDEFEHMHGAWCIAKGMVIYRDFFEHHTPALHFLLSLLLRVIPAEASVDNAVAAMLWGRKIMWVLCGAILLLTVLLGRLWGNRREGMKEPWLTGLAAGLILVGTKMFLNKTLEIRPDLLSVPMMLAGLICLVRGIRMAAESSHRWRRGYFLLGGFFLGGAIMATQKTLFVGPGVAAALLWYALDPRGRVMIGQRLLNVGWAILGVMISCGLMVGYFAWHGAAWRFIELNFVLNSQWKSHFSPVDSLEHLFKESPFLVVLGIVGGVRAFLHTFTRQGVRAGDSVVVLALASAVGGLYVYPVPHQQYHQMFLPLAAIVAVGLLVDTLDVLANWRKGWKEWRWRGYVEALLVLGAMVWGLWWLLGKYKSPLWLAGWETQVVWWMGGLLLVGWIIGWRGWMVVGVMAVLSLYPLRMMAEEFGSRNDWQLRQVRWVMEHTTPEQTVMDGWQGFGVFRPHATYYWFLHNEIRAMLTEEEKTKIIDDLKSEKIRPQVIVLDGDIKELSPAIRKYVLRYYRQREGDLWERREKF